MHKYKIYTIYIHLFITNTVCDGVLYSETWAMPSQSVYNIQFDRMKNPTSKKRRLTHYTIHSVPSYKRPIKNAASTCAKLFMLISWKKEKIKLKTKRILQWEENPCMEWTLQHLICIWICAHKAFSFSIWN